MSQTSKSPLAALDEKVVAKTVNRVVDKKKGTEIDINMLKAAKGTVNEKRSK